jgi:inosine-uridine nucleoside N-ribohydrolase
MPLLLAVLCALLVGLSPAAPAAAATTHSAAPIWIDSDTGFDDAFAIAALLRSSKVNILGISAVAGNTTLDNAANNILTLLDVGGRTEIPVVYGAAAPLVYPLSRVGNFMHGPDGMWGVQRPHDLSRLPKDPAAAICAAARANPSMTLLALGPVTNVALAARSCQADLAKITIVALNGAKLGGNRTLVAETNTYIDPQATAEMLHSGLQVTMFPLDAFDNIKFDTRNTIPFLKNSRDPLARLLADPLDTYANTQSGGQSTLFTLPDLIAALYLLDPSLGTAQNCLVVVHLEDDYWRGSTIIAVSVNDMIKTLGTDAELSALAQRVFTDRNFNLPFELYKILMRSPANAKVVLSLDVRENPTALLRHVFNDN